MTEDTRKYWNPFLETMSEEKLLEIELKNFRKHLAYAKEHSPLFKEKYHDINPEDIRSKEDLKNLPLTDKEDLRKAQAETGWNIYGKLLGVDLSEVSDFRQTSGTTGKQVY